MLNVLFPSLAERAERHPPPVPDRACLRHSLLPPPALALAPQVAQLAPPCLPHHHALLSFVPQRCAVLPDGQYSTISDVIIIS